MGRYNTKDMAEVGVDNAKAHKEVQEIFGKLLLVLFWVVDCCHNLTSHRLFLQIKCIASCIRLTFKL